MMQDMDVVEASCVFYLKVGTFDQLELSEIRDLTFTKIGIVMLTVQHDMIFSLGLM